MALSYGRMRWTNVVFAHWEVPRARIERSIPEGLSLDTRRKRAWVTVAALVAVGPAPKPLLGPEELVGYRQLNVRTYVTGAHGPGILLLETLVDSRIAAIGASLFGQPYHFCPALDVHVKGATARVVAPGIALRGDMSLEPLEPIAPRSTAGFLLNRWWVYGRIPGTGYALRVQHEPWVVRTWSPTADVPALEPLVGKSGPTVAHVAQDLEVAIVELARDGVGRVPIPVPV